MTTARFLRAFVTASVLIPLSGGPRLLAAEPAAGPALNKDKSKALENFVASVAALHLVGPPDEALLERIATTAGAADRQLAEFDKEIAAIEARLREAERKAAQLDARVAALRAVGETLAPTRPDQAKPQQTGTDQANPAPEKKPEPQKAARAEKPAAAKKADAKPAKIALSEEALKNNPGLRLFVEHVQPVLAEHCIGCHGEKKHKAGLRLDTREALLQGGDTGPAVVPGKPEESLLYITIAHLEEPFMPYDREDKLPDDVIAKVAEWIDAGAPYAGPITTKVAAAEKPEPKHWSFIGPKRPAIPAVKNDDWVRNPIDAFVLARLESKGITPAPEADRATLIRRLSLDLLGLPPAPADVDRFVNDSSPDAYDRLVDRLLASPHFGERWGRRWLDLARYADSDGYEKDRPRPYAYLYRNWVIEAFNGDLPFDRFTIEQLAGDLLPGATLEQKIATGFHRNTLTNTEGGVDQEEFRVAAVVDRVNTTGSVWLGLTLGCVQCHSHKYDPIEHGEYYRMFAFFNNADEVNVPAASEYEKKRYENALADFNAGLDKLKADLEASEKTLAGRLARWEAQQAKTLVRWTVLTPTRATSAGGANLAIRPDGSVLVSGDAPPIDVYSIAVQTDLPEITAFRVEALADPSLPKKGPGRTPHGNFVLSDLTVLAQPADGKSNPVVVALQNASATHSQKDWDVAGAIDADTATGWAIMPKAGTNNLAVFQTTGETCSPVGTKLTFILNQQYGSQHTLGHFRISAATAKGPVRATDMPDEIVNVIAVPNDKRTDAQRKKLTDYYRSIDAEYREKKKRLDEYAKKKPSPPPTKARTLVRRAEDLRETHIHVRGDFLRKGKRVRPDTPSVLHPFEPTGESGTRLDLARWLIDPANPLTTRVTVNRYWQHLFGQGLVATPEDFGTRGEKPSHPELLDWLARELIAQGWSRKEMIRLIVGSATYRQSSVTRPELIERDPKNRLLARQNRYRLEAEIVRDLYLASSGLLTTPIGGPSVRPPLPSGVAELGYAGSVKWAQSKGGDNYRRGLYIFFQRTVPYPMLTTFDAPDSNVTCTRRERSNTPLQSLTLLNDPVFYECAQALGRRVTREAPDSPAERIDRAFRLCLSRPPAEAETRRLAQLREELLAMCRADVDGAKKMIGSYALDGAEPAELAADIALGRTLLNLDELITRQ